MLYLYLKITRYLIDGFYDLFANWKYVVNMLKYYELIWDILLFLIFFEKSVDKYLERWYYVFVVSNS